MESKMSPNHFKRKDYMARLKIPTISMTRNELGKKLARIILKQQNKCLQIDMGLEPPLDGPDPPMWISPSDLLLGKLRLKPPITQKCIQALTHQGILEIGLQIDEKIQRIFEQDKARALQEKEDTLKRLFEIKMQEIISDIRREEFEKKMEQIKKIIESFEMKIFEIIDTVEILIERHLAELVTQEQLWRNKLKETTRFITRKITNEFLLRLRQQEDILLAIFREEIRDIERKKRKAIELAKKKCAEQLMHMHHALECKNIANLMFILCKERRKCHLEKVLIQAHYMEQIKNLEELSNSRKIEIETLRKRKTITDRSLHTKAILLDEVIRQFQKFINFALRACPNYGEFLLSVEKLMERFVDEIRIMNELYKTQSAAIQTEFELFASFETEPEEEEGEFESIASDIDMSKEFEFPAFCFKDNLYLKEECRDLVEGYQVKKSDKYWSDGVEYLLKIFESISQGKYEQPKITPENEDESEEAAKKRSLDSLMHHVTPSTVQFTRKPSVTSESEELNKSLLKPQSVIPITQSLQKTLRTKSILGAMDSMELLKMHIASKPKMNEVEQKQDIVSVVSSNKLQQKQEGSKASVCVSLKRPSPTIHSISSEINPTYKGKQIGVPSQLTSVNKPAMKKSTSYTSGIHEEAIGRYENSKSLLATIDSKEIIRVSLIDKMTIEKSPSLDESGTFSLQLEGDPKQRRSKKGTVNSKSNLKAISISPQIDHSAVGRTEHMKSLLATVDSLEVIKENLSFHERPKPDTDGSVCFSLKEKMHEYDNEEELEIYSINQHNIGIQTCEQRSSLKLTTSPTLVNYDDVGRSEQSKSLLAARDSLELVKSITSLPIPKPSDTCATEQTTEAKDEGEKRKKKHRKHRDKKKRKAKRTTSSDDVIKTRVCRCQEVTLIDNIEPISSLTNLHVSNSKLVLTRDSLILAKATKEMEKLKVYGQQVHEEMEERKKIIEHSDSKDVIRSTIYGDTKIRITDEQMVGLKKTPFAFHPMWGKIEMIGEKNDKEYAMSPDEFTTERVHSFIKIIRDDRSLVNLFTSCLR